MWDRSTQKTQICATPSLSGVKQSDQAENSLIKDTQQWEILESKWLQETLPPSKLLILASFSTCLENYIDRTY